MINFKKDIWPLIEGEKVSSVVTDSGLKVKTRSFTPLSEGKLFEINTKIENELKSNLNIAAKGNHKRVKTFDELCQNASSFGMAIARNYKTGKSLLVTADSFIHRDITPNMSNSYMPQAQYGYEYLWLSPAESAMIYSGKGIPELIIEKKSHSPLLNGIRIKNPRLSPKDLDKVAEDIIRLQFDMRIAEAIRDSLVYGGSLMFPKFKKDSPLSAAMSVQNLLKYGILGKDSIDRFVCLDRWNVVFTPDWNPVANAFLNPKSYFIPFLGAVLNSERSARIMTSPAAGYWGTLMTLGWGVADIPGWMESVLNYNAVMQAIPYMIKQMSLLARTFDSSGMTALEGSALMEMMETENTFKNHGTGPETLVNIDTIGELKAISRDFTQVPELVRLLRQDVGARARYPEELIWSSERGAFSSGDTSDSAFEKQTENVRYTHLKVAKQLKNVVMLFVINSLGTSDRVLKALPYTTIEFDNPKLTNAKDRSEIAAKVSKGIFDTVASGMPLYMSVDMAGQLSDNGFTLTSAFMEDLYRRQEEKDALDKKKQDLEIRLLEEQIKTQQHARTMSASGDGVKPPSKVSGGDKGKGHSYSDPLEQKKHEKIGSGRTKSVAAKQEGKKL